MCIERVAVLQQSIMLTGLKVGVGNEILNVDGQEFSDAPGMAATINSDFLTGNGKVGDSLLNILEQNRLPGEEDCLLTEMVGSGERR